MMEFPKEYKAPRVENLTSNSQAAWGQCVTGSGAVTCVGGGTAGGTCQTWGGVAGTCESPGNSAGTNCDPSGILG